MFTGLVREVGRLRSLRRSAGLTVIDIVAPRLAGELGVGDSLAVNGICFTVTEASGDRVRVDASSETRRVTTLDRWRAGDRVHLEPALKAADRLGGHVMLGHVDGVGRVVGVVRRAGTLAVTVVAPATILAQLLPKGAIALDGVSLTLDEGPFDRAFTVTLIPHTLAQTHFGALHPGDRLNLEIDVLSKAAARGPGLDARPGVESRLTEALTMDAIRARGWTRT